MSVVIAVPGVCVVRGVYIDIARRKPDLTWAGKNGKPFSGNGKAL
jgi:hypothetical protein